jgi:hypothetical protein
MRKLVAVLALCIAVPSIAVAHDATVPDPDDSAGRLDVRSVDVSHPDPGTIRFVVRFYEPHGFEPGDEHDGDSVRLDLRLDGTGPSRFKYVVLEGNPDGGLYGVLRNHRGNERSYVRAWAPDELSLAVDVLRAQLAPRRTAQRADWVFQTTYVDEEVCAAEPGDIPSTCYDVAPPGGFERHDLP